MITKHLNAREVAELLRTTPRMVTKTATKQGIGVNLGGSAGFRFTEEEIERLRQSMGSAA